VVGTAISGGMLDVILAMPCRIMAYSSSGPACVTSNGRRIDCSARMAVRRYFRWE
jgi:hypothetical protein